MMDHAPTDPVTLGREIAVFDFDDTISFGDSLAPFLAHALGPARFAWRLALIGPILLIQRLGGADRQAMKERLLSATIQGWREADLARAAETFATTHLWRQIDPSALQAIKAEAARGRAVIVVSASPELYLRPWSRLVPEIAAVIGSRLAIEDGRVTGRLAGANCRGPEKVARLEADLGVTADRIAAAYGDSDGDSAILAAAREPHFRAIGGGARPALSWLHLVLGVTRPKGAARPAQGGPGAFGRS